MRADSSSRGAWSTTSTSCSPSAATRSRRSQSDGFEVEGARVAFTQSYRGGVDAPAVVLTLDVREEPPAGVAVLDLLGRRVHGGGGVVLDSVREFCRKRGIRFEPGPWSYPGGLI